jgi:hypothetical protein
VRHALILCALLATSLSFSQGSLYAGVGKAILKNIAKPTPPRNPLEPSGFPSPSARLGELPAPRPHAEDESTLTLVSSGPSKFLNRKLLVKGGFQAKYRGYDLFGDELEYDSDKQVAIVTGNARVFGNEAFVNGQRITVDFVARNFRAEDSEVTVTPEGSAGRLTENLFLKGDRLSGNQREIFGQDCEGTTCDKEHPHFHVEGGRVTVRPGKRAIFRSARFRVFDRTLLGVPYFVVPLERRSDRYLPEVGQSQDEGYYAKFRIPVETRDDRNELYARLDYFTKLGNGFGADYLYENLNYSGSIRAYGLLGRDRTAELVTQHRQTIGRLSLSLNNNFQRQNYLNAPQNSFLSSQLNLGYSHGFGTTNFGYYRYQNDGSSFSSTQQTLSFGDNSSWSPRTRTSIDLTYTDSNSSFGTGNSRRQQLDVRFRGTQDLNKADAELSYVRSIPVGETKGFVSGSDQTPVLTLRSDSARLFGNRFGRELPSQLDFSVGEYSNPSAGNRLTRGLINIASAKPDSMSGRWGLGLDGRFQQGVYSDDTAQYTVGLNAAGRYTFGPTSSASLRYSYLESYGFTPIDFDRQGRYNFLSADLLFTPIRNVRLGAQTGYDFQLEQQDLTAWQTVGVRAEWSPMRNLQLRSLSTYDPFQKAWSNVRFDLNGRLRNGATLSAGARYDGIRKVWGNTNLYLDGLQLGRLKFGTLLSYNGYIKQFEARHFSFTYDLHCWEAVLQVIDNPIGFRSGRTINFFVRLKAAPWDTGFGLGSRGSSFGTGTGRSGF